MPDAPARALTIVDEAKAIKVVDADSYKSACDLTLAIRGLRLQVDEAYDSVIAAAHNSHKEAIAKKKKYSVPLDDAEKRLDMDIKRWRAEEKKKQDEEEIRARAKAEKEMVDLRLSEAVALDNEGFKEQAEAMMELPIMAPTPVVESNVPKVEGIASRFVWKYRIVDANKIPRDYLAPDETKIGQYGRAMKETAKIPGVEFYSEEVLIKSKG